MFKYLSKMHRKKLEDYISKDYFWVVELLVIFSGCVF